MALFRKGSGGSSPLTDAARRTATGDPAPAATTPADVHARADRAEARGNEALTLENGAQDTASLLKRDNLEGVPGAHEERRRRIAERAYRKAEARGFTPGNEEADWLEAERELDAETRKHGLEGSTGR